MYAGCQRPERSRRSRPNDRQIATRRGPKKALVAVEHAILIAIWNMAHTGAEYDDLGADYYTRRDRERVRLHAMNQLQRLGYHVHSAPSPHQPKERVAATQGVFASESWF
jgi:hypothetical protein